MIGSLAGITVLDCTSEITGPFACQLLRGLGAEVIKVEPPGGDELRRRGPFVDGEPGPDASGLFHYVNGGKRGVVLDPATPEGRAKLHRLAARADVVVEDRAPGTAAAEGLDDETLRAVNPRLIVASITPFGQTGPWTGYPATDLTISHAAGLAYGTPGLVEDPATQPPLRGGSYQASFVPGLSAAINIVAAITARDLAGDDEGAYIDFSRLEAATNVLRQGIGSYAFHGTGLSRRLARGTGAGGMALARNIRCKDGHVQLWIAGERNWALLRELLGEPAWIDDERCATNGSRVMHWEFVFEQLEAWTMQLTKQEVFLRCQGRGITCAPVQDGEELLASDVLESRGFWDWLDVGGDEPVAVPGAPFRMSATPWRPRTRGPRLGEHNDEVFGGDVEPRRAAATPRGTGRRLPLEGVRVVDFTQLVAGSHGTLWLASLGAEVVKIETSKRPDPFRISQPRPGEEASLNRNPLFAVSNVNKQTCSIDISTPRGIEVCKDLIRESDVVIENFKAGVMERFGLGYEQLRELRPDIIMAAVSGYGHTGAFAGFAGMAPNMHAFSGLSQVTGYLGGPAEQMFMYYADIPPGQAAALGVVAALRHRNRTGEGQYIDVAMSEVMVAVAAEPAIEFSISGEHTPRRANRDPVMVPHGCYPCDGRERWLAVAVASEEQWRTLAEVLGHPEWIEDPRWADAASRRAHEDALDAAIAEATRALDAAAVAEQLLAAGVPAAPSHNAADLVAHPHLLERGFITEMDQPEMGPAMLPRLPWRIAIPGLGGVEQPWQPAPLIGASTDRILREVLGLDTDAIEALRADGAIV